MATDNPKAWGLPAKAEPYTDTDGDCLGVHESATIAVFHTVPESEMSKYRNLQDSYKALGMYIDGNFERTESAQYPDGSGPQPQRLEIRPRDV